MPVSAYVFMGRSGSGKGTQVELLMKAFTERGVPFIHIETGAILRQYAKGNSYVQRIVRDLVNAGELAPDPVVVGTWISFLNEHYTGREQLIFDGAPRKLIEAVFLSNTMRFLGIEKYKIVHIDVSRQAATERLMLRARGDDVASAIEHRMDWFETDVLPALQFFRTDKDCMVIDIGGERPVEEIHLDLMRQLHLL